jgi:hypothetical protein
MPRPTLVDWNRDGQLDVLMKYDNRNALFIALGPLAGKEHLSLRPVELPGKPFVRHYAVADWDGDGNFDVLAAVIDQKEVTGDGCQQIVWFRNQASTGEPSFEEPRPLLIIPDPWWINGFDVWCREGVPIGIVVAVNIVEKGDAKKAQLWRYRWR